MIPACMLGTLKPKALVHSVCPTTTVHTTQHKMSTRQCDACLSFNAISFPLAQNSFFTLNKIDVKRKESPEKPKAKRNREYNDKKSNTHTPKKTRMETELNETNK